MPIPAILPLALGALVLVGCAKAAKDIRNARPLMSLTGSEYWAWRMQSIFRTIYAKRSNPNHWRAGQYEKVLQRYHAGRS